MSGSVRLCWRCDKNTWAGKECVHCGAPEEPCYGKLDRAELAMVIQDMLDEDVDGIAAEMEDAETMFSGRFWD